MSNHICPKCETAVIAAWRQELDGNYYHDKCLPFRGLLNHAESELTAANARIAELEKDRDFHISKWREILEQEHSISDAYVRLRTILEALSPPDLHDPHALWTYVEEVAKAKVARIAALEALLGEAIESIEDWSGYATEYFRKKHSLVEELAKFRTALEGGAK